MKLTVSILMIAGLSLAAASRLEAQRQGARGGGGTSSPAAIKHEVKDAAKRKADCNDGTPAAFYFQPGSGLNNKKWIVFLQGGGACETDAACSARWKGNHSLMTSAGLPERRATEGFVSNSTVDNPDFATFNHVIVHYCSSDAFAGDGTHTVDGRTLEFRGHRIIDAVFDDLMDKSVVGSNTLKDATDVIFAGSSAGAMGVHNNLDRIAAKLSWAKVKGVVDSGWAPDIAPFAPGAVDVGPSAPNGIDYFHAMPDESCAAANPGNIGKCLSERFVYPYVTTPLFVYADQRDPEILSAGMGITGRPSTPDQMAYVQRYGQLLRDEFSKLPAAFCPSANLHTSLGNERFHSVLIDGHSFAEILGNWYFSRSGPTQEIQQPDAGGGNVRGGNARGGGARGRGGRQ